MPSTKPQTEKEISPASPSTASEETVQTYHSDKIHSVHTPRGLRRCVYDGWRTVALNPRHCLLYLLPSALLAGGALAWFFHQFVGLFPRLFVNPELYSEGSFYATLHGEKLSFHPETLVTLLPSFLAVILTMAYAKSVLWNLIRKFSETDTIRLSFLSTYGRSTLSGILRWLAVWTGQSLLLALPLFLIGLVLYFTGLKAYILWTILLLLPVFYLFVAAISCSGRYAVMTSQQGIKGIWKSIKGAGMRRYGGIILTLLLTSIPLVFAALLLFLPSAVAAVSEATAQMSAIPGEPTGLPDDFPLYSLSLYTLSFTLIFLSSTVQTWSLAFKAASIREDEHEG